MQTAHLALGFGWLLINHRSAVDFCAAAFRYINPLIGSAADLCLAGTRMVSGAATILASHRYARIFLPNCRIVRHCKSVRCSDRDSGARGSLFA